MKRGANVISSIPQNEIVMIATNLALHFVTIHFVIFARVVYPEMSLKMLYKNF